MWNYILTNILTGENVGRIFIDFLLLVVEAAIIQHKIGPLTAAQTSMKENFINSKREAYYDAIKVLSRQFASTHLAGEGVPSSRLEEQPPTESEINQTIMKLALFSENSEILEKHNALFIGKNFNKRIYGAGEFLS